MAYCAVQTINKNKTNHTVLRAQAPWKKKVRPIIFCVTIKPISFLILLKTCVNKMVLCRHLYILDVYVAADDHIIINSSSSINLLSTEKR